MEFWIELKAFWVVESWEREGRRYELENLTDAKLRVTCDISQPALGIALCHSSTVFIHRCPSKNTDIFVRR